MSSNDFYTNVKNAVDNSSGGEERVEVNQRALIDKILARYASAGAVYRELLQNSNDAEATLAEIYFTTNRDESSLGVAKSDAIRDETPAAALSQQTGTEIVTSVTYRNNGLRFRPQDWSRLKKIAEGNPDESKIGAFGVGAYTMFSICEEPLVLSGTQALAFFWKGDALWTKTIPTTNRPKEDEVWTSFVLPSRDPYKMPDLVEFGEFLCASLTFTKCLSEIRVFVNRKRRLTLVKTALQEPTVVKINSKSMNSRWFSWTGNGNKGGAVTVSSNGLFSLRDDQSLLESLYHIQVEMDGNVASVTARYLSAIAKTSIPTEMTHRMERVTKKKPPSKVEIQIFLSHDQTLSDDVKSSRKERGVRRIVESFSPRIGEGRIFIGFRTSQTTGLAAHLAAPFVPTVEREAMDLQDYTLRVFNLELLDFAGIVMRLTLEHSMGTLGIEYEKGAYERKQLEVRLLQQAQETQRKKKKTRSKTNGNCVDQKQIVLMTNNDNIGYDEGNIATKCKSETPSSIFGFAKFMAKGITKTIKNVVTNLNDLVDEAGGGELIHPLDPRPLCVEEHQCILLMQSFCPRQSTPDPLVGTALAQGFSRCIDRTPPVLTRSGVIPGDQARLPNKGMEAFVSDDVVRTVVYQNTEEYHDVIAQCRKLNLDDLIQKISEEVLEETKIVRLIKWWAKFNKIQPQISTVQGVKLKEHIRFFSKSTSIDERDGALSVHCLKDFLFYVDKEKIRCGSGYSIQDLPMPDTILPTRIQDEVTTRVLGDRALIAWFTPLPVEIWIGFVSQHSCMTSGQPEYENVRLRVLSTLGNEHRSRSLNDQQLFGNFCQSVLKDKRCLPFDSTEPTNFSADLPSNLYLHSAELSMFGSVGNFHKVSKSLHTLGVSDEFLLSLGVRKSVSVDFLFENLQALKYSDDPKPLVEYLRSASLTNNDIQKLRSTQYLPAENDPSRMFSPGELYLPDPTLRIFPFVRLIEWPSEEDVTERSINGKFLVTLGMKPLPDLLHVLRYISKEVTDDTARLLCIDFVAKRLGSGGAYQSEYSRLSRTDKSEIKFLPCLITSPLSGEHKRTCCSITNCWSNPAPGVMGFPVLNINGKNKLYGNLFQCTEEPNATALLQQLLVIVSLAKKTLKAGVRGDHKILYSHKIIDKFSQIFTYMSSRSPEVDARKLVEEEFIPCLVGEEVEWFRPTMVFFENSSPDNDGDITRSLFHVVSFSPFLASAGVRQEVTTRDIFKRMVTSPKEVLAAVKSEENYRTLLRRIASHPPFSRVTREIRDSPFLLAYRETETNHTNEKVTFELTTAADILVIDNSFFGRMFPAKRAPHESDLEVFYASLGAAYISKVVKKKFDIIGAYQKETSVTGALMERIQERSPLLLSTSNSSRSLLVNNAPSILERRNLEILQVPQIKAIYSLGKSVRAQRTSCCIEEGMFGKKSLFVTKDFDWFDVGFAIGEIILKRCQLEDAFLISSLLEAPLEQLRARGFPVDRIIRTEPPSTQRSEIDSIGISSTSDETIFHRVDPKSDRDSTSQLPQKGSLATTPKSTKHSDKYNGDSRTSTESKDDHVSILKEMYPDVDVFYLRKKLGENPNIDRVRNVAEEMAMQDYPKEKHVQQRNSSKKDEEKPSKLLGSKKLGKALKNFGALPNHLKLSGSQSMHRQPTGESCPIASKDDALLQRNMERMLQQKVQNSPQVGVNGFQSPQVSLSIPEGLDHGNSCELIPSQDVAPYVGENGKAESHNGIKLFYYRKDQSSKSYLRVNHDAVENFAVVLERLCYVFALPLKSVAIYHDPTGKAIAFNRGGALYFNFRYFYGLHFSNDIHWKKACYSYWYVVFCHELAHNMEGPHNRTHAFYTESYTSLYLPKLMSIFQEGDD